MNEDLKHPRLDFRKICRKCRKSSARYPKPSLDPIALKEVNKQIVRNGVEGFWAQSESEWESALFQLYESQDERVKMGLKARERILANYSIEAALPKMINAFKKALSIDEKFRQVG